MSKINIVDQTGKVVGEAELDDYIFDIEPNEPVVHEAVVQYLANQRQGTQSTKTRGEVRGGGRKPWRQKGTGRARAGSRTSPLWRGGGIIFAPKPRDYSKKMNKKKKNLAFRSVFSDKNQNNELTIIDDITLAQPKTKDMIEILDALNIPKGIIVTDTKNDNVVLSTNNIPKVKTTTADEINVYDLLYFENLILTQAALDKIQEVYKKHERR